MRKASVGCVWSAYLVQPGRHAANESGFRNIVRTALEELPAEWTLDVLRAWVAEHLPHAQIPYGSWTSTLYKMTQAGELNVRGKKHFARGKIYSRGPKRVTPTGSQLTELDQAWQEFRKTIKTDLPEMESFSERGES